MFSDAQHETGVFLQVLQFEQNSHAIGVFSKTYSKYLEPFFGIISND